MTAIPMAMGFAIAMGLRPEQGIIAGAPGVHHRTHVRRLEVSSLWADGCVHSRNRRVDGEVRRGCRRHIRTGARLPRPGQHDRRRCFDGDGPARASGQIPPSSYPTRSSWASRSASRSLIAMSNAGEALGLSLGIKGGVLDQTCRTSGADQSESANWYAFGIAILTFVLTRSLLKISVFIPAPLMALGLATALTAYVFPDQGIVLIKDRFGDDSHQLLRLQPGHRLARPGRHRSARPRYFVFAIVFVSAVESVLCSSMADRLADNRKTSLQSRQGTVGPGARAGFTPLVNGFPCTGAPWRTATSIKAGAVTPLAGYFKGALKLVWPCSGLLPRLRADGLHRRHSPVGRQQHDQAQGTARGLAAQPVPRGADDLHGRHGPADRFSDGRPVGADPLCGALSLLRSHAAFGGCRQASGTGGGATGGYSRAENIERAGALAREVP